jgi:hypothetical protein
MGATALTYFLQLFLMPAAKDGLALFDGDRHDDSPSPFGYK